MVPYENYHICIFMNINENLKMKEKALGKLVSKRVIIMCVNLFNVTTQMPKNIILKNKCTLVILNLMVSMATHYVTLMNGV